MKRRKINKRAILEFIIVMAILVMTMNESVFIYNQIVETIQTMDKKTFWDLIFVVFQIFLKAIILLAVVGISLSVYFQMKLRRKLVGKSSLPFNRRKR